MSILNLRNLTIYTSVLLALPATAAPHPVAAQSKTPASEAFTSDFKLEPAELATIGRNRYWILEPDFRIVLAGEGSKVAITVLAETEEVGAFTTRVVEEREWSGDELVEVSRNYYAISRSTGDVYYFGEAVDVYRNGAVTGHPGSWRAFEGGAEPGLMMPGAPQPGQRFYEELAPGVAMDRAEVVSLGATLTTPSGESLERCLQVAESSGLDPQDRSAKLYAPGIGLVRDDEVVIVSHGFVPRGPTSAGAEPSGHR